HAPGIQGNDLVVKTGETALVLGDQQRLEAAVSVARHLDADRAILGQHRLGTLAIALVADRRWLSGPGRVAQVMVHLTGQGALDQRLLEGQGRSIDGFGRHRTVTERLQQLWSNGRQRGWLGSWFAWHRHSLASCYASNTKLMTGPAGTS